MLALCLGHSDFITQATSRHKLSLQPGRSSSFFFFITQASVFMVYFINRRNGQPINAGEKEKNMVVFLN